ncbi:MAG: cytochrome c-type biogenesis protein CcmH [Solirubrobacterales bacterium]
MSRAVTLAALALGLLALAPAAGAMPQTTVNEIEGEVMCPICGTLLELSDSPQAQRERVYVARLVVAGKSKAEIKDDLVAQYGPAVLALPKASGFDLTAYLVPVLGILVAAIALAFSVTRWRRDGKRLPPEDAKEPAPQGEDAERLEADLSRYDL